MLKKGYYTLLISLLFIAEDVLSLNVLFFAMRKTLQPVGADETYSFAATIFNLAYLLSVAVAKFEIDPRRLRMRDIVRRTVYRLSVAAMIFGVGILYAGIVGKVSGWFIGALFIGALPVLTLAHWVTRRALTFAFLRVSGNAIVLGAGVPGCKVYDELKGDVYRGVNVLGIFDDGFDSLDKPVVLDDNHRVLGTLDDAKRFASKHGVTKIYCTLSRRDEEEKILDFLNFAELNVMEFHIVPVSSYYYGGNYAMVETLDNVPVFSTRISPLYYKHNAVVKRALDLIVSSVFIVTILLLLYILVGLAVKLTSPGPVFFVQKRTGRYGREFKCYKFRSMRRNKDADTRQAEKDDARITSVGRFIRKTNIDETPQFCHVFSGKMSLVGPRPHMLAHTEEYSGSVTEYMVRHLIKPGITGWAQVNGFRGETRDIEQMSGRIRKDIEYFEKWSLGLDLKILFKTLILTFKGDKKAY